MNLDKVWDWGQKKLNCRMLPESHNPAADALRDDLHKKLAELAGVNLQDLLAEMKKRRTGAGVEKKIKEIRNTAFVLGSSKTWDEVNRKESSAKLEASTKLEGSGSEPPRTALRSASGVVEAASAPGTCSSKNIYKKYFVIPKSPPKRVLLDLQRERAKPPIVLERLEAIDSKDKIEASPTKKRHTRMTAIEIAAKLEKSFSAESTAQADPSKLAEHFRAYAGDRFSNRGEYLDGMMYLSRMPGGKEPRLRPGGSLLPSPDKESRPSAASKKDFIDADNSNGTLSTDGGHDVMDLSEDNDTSSDVDTKLYCAACLCNWSRIPSNARQLATEGAVRAVMQLSSEPNYRIQKYCAAAFRYMSESPILGSLMIDENSISVMSDLVSSANNDFVSGSVVIALVNLTRVGGKEGFQLFSNTFGMQSLIEYCTLGMLVDSGMVLALQNVISLRPDLNAACARALYNLTCVDSAYPSMERVIRVLVSLSSSGVSTVKHVCAAALCVRKVLFILFLEPDSKLLSPEPR